MAAKTDSGLGSLSSAKSADRALMVLEFLSRRTQPTPTMIIGAECDIPKSSVHNLLNLMRERRFVTYHKSARAWSVGPRLYELGGDAPLLVHALAIFKAFEQVGHHLMPNDIARRSQLPEHTVTRTLPVLEENGLLTRTGDGRYALGLQLISLAAHVGDLDRVRVVARPSLLELRDATGETANLVVRDNDQALYIDQVQSRQALRHTGWIGRQIPIGRSAAGAVLSGAAGVRVVRDSVEEGVTAVACAIDGIVDPPAALSVTGPTFRLQRERLDLACDAVRRAARIVGAALADRTRLG
jgi:IclR family transcriptional regulator, acetate operon repressor